MSTSPASQWHRSCYCPIMSGGQECQELKGTGVCWEVTCRPGLERSLESDHILISCCNRFIRRDKKKVTIAGTMRQRPPHHNPNGSSAARRAPGPGNGSSVLFSLLSSYELSLLPHLVLEGHFSQLSILVFVGGGGIWGHCLQMNPGQRESAALAPLPVICQPARAACS